MEKLSKNELKELKGGALPPGGGEPGIPGDTDVINTNKIRDCRCTFQDYSLVENKNTERGCICTCRK